MAHGGTGGTSATGGFPGSGGTTNSGGGGDAGYWGGTGGVGGTGGAAGTGGVAGIGGIAGGGGAGGVAGHPVTAVPPVHRAIAMACSDGGAALTIDGGDTRWPTGDGGVYTGLIHCTTDSSCPPCADGLRDRCVALGGGGASGAPVCACDQCNHDSDCGPNGVCSCDGSTGNICLTGNCRVDSDCGPAGYCSPSSAGAGCGSSPTGYYCHTPQDQCRADSDCPGFPYKCNYSAPAGFWACTQNFCAG
jgi:hypothetical protein